MEIERRGRRLFLVMATITVLAKLGALLPMMAGPEPGLGKLAAVITAVSVVLLWRGAVWTQWLTAGAFLSCASLMMFEFALSLEALDLYGAGVLFKLFLALVDVLAGLAILLRRDLNAFFRHQREATGRDLASPPRPRDERMKLACLWGLALGGGIGILNAARWAQDMPLNSMSALEFGEIFEVLPIGLGTACVLGVVAGFAVAAADPGVGLSTRRLVITRGLMAAGYCVVAAVACAAIYGGLFAKASSYIPSSPGLPRAALSAFIFAVYGGPVIALAGFALGAPLALIMREGEDKKPTTDWAE